MFVSKPSTPAIMACPKVVHNLGHTTAIQTMQNKTNSTAVFPRYKSLAAKNGVQQTDHDEEACWELKSLPALHPFLNLASRLLKAKSRHPPIVRQKVKQARAPYL